MPKTSQAKIYIGEELSRILGPTDQTGDLQSRLQGICRRYEMLIQNNIPTLTHGEWCCIMDANNGTSDVLVEDPRLCGSMIWANVADSVDMDDKWGIDSVRLVRTLQRMSPSELLAVFEAVIRFWMHHEKPTDEALKLAGCSMSGEPGRRVK